MVDHIIGSFGIISSKSWLEGVQRIKGGEAGVIWWACSMLYSESNNKKAIASHFYKGVEFGRLLGTTTCSRLVHSFYFTL